MTAPIASGWSEGLHPLESAAFARRTPKADLPTPALQKTVLGAFGLFAPGRGGPRCGEIAGWLKKLDVMRQAPRQHRRRRRP